MANNISGAKLRSRCHPGSDVWHFISDCSCWPDAVYAAEELEEAAKLYLLLRGTSPRLLTGRQVDDLLTTFG